MHDPDRVLFEVCVDTAMGAEAAAAGGADRVELCANLLEGGTTPSAGAVAWAVEHLDIPVMVLIRPRGGDFVYSPGEQDVMLRDIAVVKALGAKGVVVGALRIDGSLCRTAMQAFVAAARPMQVTCHRAFDMCRDPRQTLEQLIELGVDRVLTSGQRDAAADGVELLAELVRQAGDRIRVMPGGGIFEHDVRWVVEGSGARELHFAAAVTRPSPMLYRNPDCTMGCGAIPDEYDLVVTDPGRVQEYIRHGSGGAAADKNDNP